MPITIEPRYGLARRLAWFAGLWLAGVLSIGAVAMAIRAALHAG